jgi:CO/xanthine dehydrogenase Mo-binding subunit
MKKRGVGIAAAQYPTGLAGGGDVSQAYVKVNPDGTTDLFVGSVDIGQGCKTVLAQMAAEELGIPYEQVRVHNQGTDTSPICFGTFASRVTYAAGNAVVEAAREARSMLFEAAAPALQSTPEALEVSEGRIFVRDDPGRSIGFRDVANMANIFMKKMIVGQGLFARDHSATDPDTGACDPFCTMAWAAQWVEVEVDTDTGEVEVLRMVSAFDVGRAINPMLVEGQIEGGAVMGMGAALMEDLYPHYPTPEGQPTNLNTYVIPTARDVPEKMESVIVECPSTAGPHGAKGIGEMTANVPAPAIVSAIHDAVGVWIDEIPVTPERLLRALEKAASQGERE